jgi:O-antigen/teichoic acid export membrane protein
LFAAAFPVMVLVVFGLGLDQNLFSSALQGICLLWILSRFVGLLPTVWDTIWADNALPQMNSTASDGAQSQLKNEAIRPHEISLTQLLRQGRSFGVSVLANELFERVDLLLIILLATLDQAGQYFVTIPIATLMVLLPNTVSLFAFNWGAQRTAVFSPQQIFGVTIALLLFQVLSCLVLLAILPWLIHTFYGADFDLAISFSQWLLPIAIIRGLVQIVDAYAKGCGIVSWTIGARIASLMLALLVISLTYPAWQLFSIPLGMAAGQLLSLLVIGWGCWRENTVRSKATVQLGSAR